MHTENWDTWMDEYGNDYPDPETPPLKGTAPNNYRPIMCQPMMWKILMAQIREEIYYSLIRCGLFSDEQKGCHKGTRGMREGLYIDQHILKSKTRWKI